MSAASRSSTAEISEVVPQMELLRILECPVCKEVPFPPIFSCRKGHIICHQCKPKLLYCALCKVSFSNARNFAVESIIMSSKHACKYKEYGCNVILTGDLILRHLDVCEYGGLKVRCHLGKYKTRNNHQDCQIKMFPVHKYLDHLKEKHMILRSVSTTPVIIFDSPTLTDLNDTFWLGDYQIYDGETFIVRQFVASRLIYFGIAVIADVDVAKKYYVTINISSKNTKVANKVEWTVPVHSITCSEEAILDTYCGVAPISYIMNLSEIVLSQWKEKMIFQVEYKIHFSKEHIKK